MPKRICAVLYVSVMGLTRCYQTTVFYIYICLIATAQRPNCSYNNGYIAYFYCACAKRPYFRYGFEDVFSWFFHGKSKNSAIFLIRFIWPNWPSKRATCWATNVDHFRQVWSWYDYPSPSYSVVGADTLRDLVTLTFDLLTLDNSQLSYLPK